TYLTQAEPVARDVNAAIAEMRGAIDRSYEADLTYVNAVVDVRLGTRIAVGRDRLGRLEPEESVAPDAAAYENLLGRLQELARTIDGSMVSPPDKAAAAIAAAELELEAAATFSALTPQACRFTTFDFALCADDTFFTGPEQVAHRALEEAATVFVARSVMPRSPGPA
ncbi:MAG: hypothetical protein GWN79_02675, partial [Actinobacteria bacterium]|nr:hypothetical protein [Actinomycetota bacterium]NIS29708.1 hypothetical protein [Actinomycetota bacterium]NIU18058.1 hypothetical protein [Actinomycetota bacterium]NIU65030.1 hypothetical protein [Actinomycetota bacterium]NIV85863.1 hypothetical protein [Actinomycetota bacterium]